MVYRFGRCKLPPEQVIALPAEGQEGGMEDRQRLRQMD